MRQTFDLLGTAGNPCEITGMSFANPNLGLPNFSGMVGPMKTKATPALAAAVDAAMKAERLTHDGVHDLGGPSSPTLTKILLGEGASISMDTEKKLEKAFGWPTGRVAALAADAPDLRAERQALGMNPTEMAAALGVGPQALLGWEAGAPIPPSVLEKVRALLAELPRSELLAELMRREEAG